MPSATTWAFTNVSPGSKMSKAPFGPLTSRSFSNAVLNGVPVPAVLLTVLNMILSTIRMTRFRCHRLFVPRRPMTKRNNGWLWRIWPRRLSRPTEISPRRWLEWRRGHLEILVPKMREMEQKCEFVLEWTIHIRHLVFHVQTREIFVPEIYINNPMYFNVSLCPILNDHMDKKSVCLVFKVNHNCLS